MHVETVVSIETESRVSIPLPAEAHVPVVGEILHFAVEDYLSELNEEAAELYRHMGNYSWLVVRVVTEYRFTKTSMYVMVRVMVAKEII